jgi:rod shape determining protein RodA
MQFRAMLNLTQLGWGLAIPVLLLCLAGTLCIHATDRSADGPQALLEVDAGELPLDGWLPRLLEHIGPLTARHVIYLLTGVGLMLLTLTVPYQKIGRASYALYGLTVVLLIVLLLDRAVDLPLIAPRKGARRWIDLGLFAVQPGEFMKLALTLTLARYLRFRSSYREWRGLLIPFLLTLGPMALILLQPNLGTTLMMLPMLFVMLFVAGARLRHLALIVALGLATLPVFYFYGMQDYQRTRVLAVIRQFGADEAWHTDEGFQLRQAKIALGSGGLTGAGYGEGVFIRHDLLPEEHNDFIFAIIGHQWGLVGCLVILLAYALIVLFGCEVAMATNDPFGRLLAIGICAMIVVQALLNICITIGLAPITGMTLPFVSAGGSSLWTNFIGVGLLVNIAQRRPLLIARPPFEYEDAT